MKELEIVIPIAFVVAAYFLMKNMPIKVKLILMLIITSGFVYLSVIESENRYFNMLLVLLGAVFIVKNVIQLYFKKSI